MRSDITIKGHFIAKNSFTAEEPLKMDSKSKNGQKKQKTTLKVK